METNNIIRIANSVIDVRQVTGVTMIPNGASLQFRNGEVVNVVWRDDKEKTEVMEKLKLVQV